MCVLRLVREVLTDVLNGYEGVHLDAEFLTDLHDSGLAGVLADLAAVDRDEHIGYLDVRAALEHRHGLTDRGACGDNVLDDDDAVAVLRLVADDAAALAVVLRFLAVEEERLVDAVVAGERTGNRGRERNALVCRAEHRVEVVAYRLLDESGIELAQTGVLHTGLIVAGVDKIRGLAAGLGREVAETQNVRAHHKLDKFLLRFSQHGDYRPLFSFCYYQYNKSDGICKEARPATCL